MSNSNNDTSEQIKGVQMTVTKQSSFGNMSMIGTITIRQIISFGLTIGVGILLLKTPLFRWNYLAIIAYAAFVSVIMGQTPTGRNVMLNLYGVLFRKPQNMIVTEDMTIDTMGHGISEVELDEQGLDAVPFRMAGTKNYALVYNITSGINYWSSNEDKINQAIRVKNMFNILEGGEGISIVEKQDNDTGMLKLRENLLEKESFDTDTRTDLQRMSDKRSTLLYNAGTSPVGRSIQQYAVVLVKPKNVSRVIKEFRNISRVTRPATNPADVLLSMMGLEGGVEWTGDYTKESVVNGTSRDAKEENTNQKVALTAKEKREERARERLRKKRGD